MSFRLVHAVPAMRPSFRALLSIGSMSLLACGGEPRAEPGEAPARDEAPDRAAASALPCVEGEPPAGTPADRLAWMIGTGRSEEDGATTTERWCAGEGGVLVGDNATRAGGEVVHSEVLRVEARGDRLVYVASPSGQATTEFTGQARCGSDVTGNCARSCEAVFENPEHDFPQTITYGRCLQSELLVATIAGGERRASWTFRRFEP